MNKIAVIPARGGSKRIPRKNIRDFCGKPMIAWSIEAAQHSNVFDRVIVSTDDPEVRDIAKRWGAEVPFERPEELSSDYTGTLPVIRHAVTWLSEHGQPPSDVCCIYATAPFIQEKFLIDGIRILEGSKNIDFVFSATPFDFPVFRAMRLDEDQAPSMIWPEHEMTRSQDLPPAYHDAAQFYWGTFKAWQRNGGIFSSNSRAVILPPHLVQDIDTPEDWIQAELKMYALRHNEVSQ